MQLKEIIEEQQKTILEFQSFLLWKFLQQTCYIPPIVGLGICSFNPFFYGNFCNFSKTWHCCKMEQSVSILSFMEIFATRFYISKWQAIEMFQSFLLWKFLQRKNKTRIKQEKPQVSILSFLEIFATLK